jgi:hypothetical protein
VPDWFKQKSAHLCPVTDLARLKVAREYLSEGFQRTVWVDADMLVFAPQQMAVEIESQFAYCHEVWTGPDEHGQPACGHRVNNSISVFVEGNAYLDFFIDACEQNARAQTEVAKLDASTRFLSMLHQILPFPLLYNVGMLSPALMTDIANGTQHYLPTFGRHLQAPIACANLCASLQGQTFDGRAQMPAAYDVVIDRLLESRGEVVNRHYPGPR